MSKLRKENFVRRAIKTLNKKKQRIKSKQLLKNIVNEFNYEPHMRGLGDTGHLRGEW